MPGDTTEFLRGKIAERGRQGHARFSRDGFDRWAEGTNPARSGQAPKLPTEMPTTGGGFGSFLKKAGKAIKKVAEKGHKFYTEHKDEIHGAIDLAKEHGPGLLEAVGGRRHGGAVGGRYINGGAKLNVVTNSRPHTNGRWYLEWTDVYGPQSMVFPSHEAAQRWAEMQGISGAGFGSFLKKAGKTIGNIAKKGHKFYTEHKDEIHGAIDLAKEHGPGLLEAVGGRRHGGRRTYEQETPQEIKAREQKVRQGLQDLSNYGGRRVGGDGEVAATKMAEQQATRVSTGQVKSFKKVGNYWVLRYSFNYDGKDREKEIEFDTKQEAIDYAKSLGISGAGFGSFLKKAGKTIGNIAKKGHKFYTEHKDEIHGAIDLAKEHGPGLLEAVGGRRHGGRRVGGRGYESPKEMNDRIVAETKRKNEEKSAARENAFKDAKSRGLKYGKELTIEQLKASSDPSDVQGGSFGSFLKKAGKTIKKVAEKGHKFYTEHKDEIHGAIDLAKEHGPGLLEAVGGRRHGGRRVGGDGEVAEYQVYKGKKNGGSFGSFLKKAAKTVGNVAKKGHKFYTEHKDEIHGAIDLAKEHGPGLLEAVGGRKPNARAMIVKKIMAQKGLSMIEASKYVKAHGLY